MKYNSSHTEYINKKGVEVPSVTTIIKILNKPSLVKWANYMGFKRQDVDYLLEKSSHIGTCVHDLVESYLMNYYYIFIPTDYWTSTLYKLYMDTIMEWRNTHNIDPIFSEKKFCSERFGGTVDFYGVIDNKHTIIDFKTSKRFYSTMFLQLAAYCIMLEENNYKVDQVGIVILNPEGYNEKIITREELTPYIDTFRLLVELFHKWFDLNIEKGWGNILV